MAGKVLLTLGIAGSILLVACGGGGGDINGNGNVADGNRGATDGGMGNGNENTEGDNNVFSISSRAIPEGGTVPVKYTCDNANGVGVSPDMSWENPPAGTKSFAVLVYDESVSDPSDPNDQVPFFHWLVLNIPTNITSIDEGYEPPAGSNITVYPNSFGRSMYIGPCPPNGDPAHIYKFCVAALNVENINPNDYQNRLAVYDAVDRATIEKACISARYQR